ncbi:MAG: response regulator [Armatimonadetes bacterium]|nr:response regulator [Armatimonadota bacterium]
MSTDWLAAAAQLVSAPSRSALAKRAVEIACTHLGVERCSLWLREGNCGRGTWGISLAGKTVDEGHLSFTFAGETAEAMAGDAPWVLMPGPHSATDGERCVSFDWIAATPLRTDGETIGVFYNDCAGSGAAIDERRQAEVVAYAGVVARLLRQLQRAEEAEMLADLASALTALMEPAQMAQAVAERTQPLLGWDRFCLACLSDDGMWFEQVGVSTGPTPAVTCQPGQRLAVDQFGKTMAPLVERQPLLLSCPTAEQVHPGCPGIGLGSAYYQPIVSRDALIGVLMVAAVDTDRYAVREAELIGAVAAIVAPTLDRMNEARRAKQSAEEYGALVRAIPDLTLVYDRDGVCLAVPSPERLSVAASVDEVLGRGVTDVFGPELQPVVDALRRAIDQGETVSVRYRLAAGGRQAWFEGRAQAMGDHALWIARDITDAVLAEERLREARLALDHAAELAQVGAWLHDLRQDQMVWSESMCRLHGLPESSIRISPGEVLERFGHPEDGARLDAAVREAVSQRKRLDETVRVRRADGAWRQCRMVGDVWCDGEGRPTHLAGMMQDITEQKEQDAQRQHLESRLAQASKMEAIGQLAGGVAHDFNNLLTTINGYAEFVLGDLPADSAYRDDLEEISRAAQRAASLTRQLLAFSRRSLIRPTDLELNQVARDMERMLGRLIGEHIELEVVLSPEPLHLRADGGQVEQIVMNLAVNAKDAMRSGGRLTITAGHAQLAQADLGPLSEVEPGEFVTITVADTGCGMTPEVLARAFEPFYTTKPVGEGTGLGLASVYGAIRQNRGHITCHSEVGVGTRFVVYLPRLHAPTLEPDVAEPAAPGGREHILLVEDDPAVRGFVERSLRRAGYVLRVADSGSHALRVAETGRIDLLVTDVIMPGKNGLEVATELAAARPDMRVLFISGYTAAVIEQQGLTPARAPLLVKPFGVGELLGKVRELLDQ